MGTGTKGPWPTPAQDVVEVDAKTLAGDWDGWGHRKLAELKRVGIDDVAAGEVSDSTMFRVLERNGLCLPANYPSEVRHLAGIRKKVLRVLVSLFTDLFQFGWILILLSVGALNQ